MVGPPTPTICFLDIDIHAFSLAMNQPVSLAVSRHDDVWTDIRSLHSRRASHASQMSASVARNLSANGSTDIFLAIGTDLARPTAEIDLRPQR